MTELQEAAWLIEGDGALAAQIRLQIGHQESGRDAFTRDVADHQPEAVLAQAEKIVVIAAYLAGLDAGAGVLQSLEPRQFLREKPGLHLLGDFEFLGGAAFGFLFSRRAARRCASICWLITSKPTSPKVLPSASWKRVKTPPQIGGGSAV